MVVMFEVAGGFRLRPKIERHGPLVRVIWAYFSVAFISAGFNDVWRAFRMDEAEECARLCDKRAAIERAKADSIGPLGGTHHLWAAYTNAAAQNELMAKDIRHRRLERLCGS